jgi:hypothetical protein
VRPGGGDGFCGVSMGELNRRHTGELVNGGPRDASMIQEDLVEF